MYSYETKNIGFTLESLPTFYAGNAKRKYKVENLI